MKLALLSDDSTSQATKIVASLIATMEVPTSGRSVAYLASEPDQHRQYFARTVNFYESIGVTNITYLDLENDYDDAVVSAQLSAASIIHLSGGDTYRFLYWLKARGLDAVLRDLAQSGTAIVGVSAGALIMTPTIDSATLCGDINRIGLMDCTALGLVAFLFSPHATKGIAEQHRAMTLLTDQNNNIVLCADSDALMINGNHVIEYGQPLWLVSQ